MGRGDIERELERKMKKIEPTSMGMTSGFYLFWYLRTEEGETNPSPWNDSANYPPAGWMAYWIIACVLMIDWMNVFK